MTNNELRDRIREVEITTSGADKLCDVQVSVVNIRKNKQYYIADIIYSELDGGSQRFNHMEYPREVIERTG